jgi:hypothetical protein
MHATVVTSALFIPYPKLHSPPHGGKALCGRNIFPIVRCPRLLFDPLRVVGERPSEGGVPLVQTFLCIDNPSVSGTSVPARLTSTTLSTAAASSTTAVDGSPRHVSLPSNSVVLSEARVRRGRAQPRPRRVASPSNFVGGPFTRDTANGQPLHAYALHGTDALPRSKVHLARRNVRASPL